MYIENVRHTNNKTYLKKFCSKISQQKPTRLFHFFLDETCILRYVCQNFGSAYVCLQSPNQIYTVDYIHVDDIYIHTYMYAYFI